MSDDAKDKRLKTESVEESTLRQSKRMSIKVDNINLLPKKDIKSPKKGGKMTASKVDNKEKEGSKVETSNFVINDEEETLKQFKFMDLQNEISPF